MSKSAKKIIIGVIMLVLILAIIWAIYETMKPEPVSIEATNELPNENMGVDDVTNDFLQNEVINDIEENKIVNETTDKSESNEVVENESSKDDKESDTEVISGTNMSRNEKAIEIAKKYYEEEYGSIDGVYFDNQGIYNDGRYIVRAGTAGQSMNLFLLVNIESELVEEK